MKTTIEALASHLDMDVADLKEYRYHPSRTTKPLYTSGDDYLCAVKGNAKPSQSTEQNSDEWFWDEVPSTYVNSFGYKIYRRLTEDEAYERGLIE